MPAARSVRDEPPVETSCANHMSTKSRLRKTAVGDTCTTACAWLTEPPHVPPPGEPPVPGPGRACGDWHEVYGSTGSIRGRCATRCRGDRRGVRTRGPRGL